MLSFPFAITYNPICPEAVDSGLGICVGLVPMQIVQSEVQVAPQAGCMVYCLPFGHCVNRVYSLHHLSL